MGSDKARPAYVEDVEGDEDSDNNRTIRNTRVSARASKKDKTQRREKRAKEKKKSLSEDGYSSLAVQTRADERATVKEVRVIPDREPREGRRKSLNINPGKSPRKSSRPPTQRNVSFDHPDLPSRPKDRDDPRYFGERNGHPVVIQAQSTPRPAPSSASSSQSRQARPISVSSSHISRPPLSGSAYYPQPNYTTAPIMIPPQYQNPMQMAYSPSQPASPSRRTLEDRFARTGATIVRPSSVSGYRPSDLALVQRGADYDDDDDSYDSEAEEQAAQEAFMKDAVRMKEARRRAAKELQDAIDMPPPRPITRHRSVRQPSEQPIFLQDQDDEPQPRRSRDDPRDSRRSRDYDFRPSGEFDRRPSGEYERPSPRRPSPRRRESRNYEFDERERPTLPKITYRGGDAPQPRARRQSLPRAPESNESLSFAYDRDDRDDANIRIEAASGRRASYYGGLSNPSSNYEDKVRDATGYQADVSGGEPVKLTAEVLRKQQNTIGSSSTHSSNSRGESDFKRSVTTRTTRSVSGNDAAADDVTIRIKGNAKVTIGAAEITNADGVELNIVNNRRQSIRNGSEASRSEYAPSQSQGAPSEYAPTATDERERERERKGRREILGAPPAGRDRAASVTAARRRGLRLPLPF